MRVGFLNNQIDNRGTGNAVFNYAHYNETILGNKSFIFTFPDGNHSASAVEKYEKRFGEILTPHNVNYDKTGIDVLYHIKSGEIDMWAPDPNIRYAVHAVFHPQQQGDRFAVISEWMGLRDNFPFVPHIVSLPDTHLDLRESLGIPKDATVIGRLGGYDSFDIDFVWRSVESALWKRSDIWFLFLNTAPYEQLKGHPRVIHFPATLDDRAKRAFINTCDAMLHARSRGETFGISVGEFAILGKPIFTFDGSYEKAHIYELRGTARTYSDEDDLTSQLMAFRHGETNHPFYTQYTPENVMKKFKEVFLD